MKNSLLKKATFVVALSLVSTQIHANWSSNFNFDSAKDTVSRFYSGAKDTACQLWSETSGWTKSQGNDLRAFGDSALKSFNELDTNYKVLVGSAVVVATGGILYGLYKVKNAIFGKPTTDKKDK